MRECKRDGEKKNNKVEPRKSLDTPRNLSFLVTSTRVLILVGSNRLIDMIGK